MPNFNLTPRQINAIKNSAKGVLPAFLGPINAVGKAAGKAAGKTMPSGVGGAMGRALRKRK